LPNLGDQKQHVVHTYVQENWNILVYNNRCCIEMREGEDRQCDDLLSYRVRSEGAQ
jgi:hypothetical protein